VEADSETGRWTVRGRGGSVDFEFSDRTGRSLLSLGLIQLEPGEAIPALHQRRKARFAMVRYVPTAWAVAMVADILARAVA
jgi:hypothetical protein